MLRAAHRYPTSLKVEFLRSRGSFAGDAVNISTGGLFVRTDRRVSQGARLSLALAFPDGEPPALARAKVVHVAQGESETGLGIQFVEDRDAFRARVDRHIDSILHQGNAAALRLLSSARDLLLRRGWIQLADQDGEKGFCLSGALREVAHDDHDAYQAALQSVGPRLDSGSCAHGGFGCHCAVVRWNDAEGRTQQQVLAKLDEVIDAEIRSSAAVH